MVLDLEDKTERQQGVIRCGNLAISYDMHKLSLVFNSREWVTSSFEGTADPLSLCTICGVRHAKLGIYSTHDYDVITIN